MLFGSFSIFIFCKSFYFLTKPIVTYHPLEMVRLLRQTQPQPLPHLWLANGQHFKLGSSFSNESVKKVSHNNGLWSDTWFWLAIRRCCRRFFSVILMFWHLESSKRVSIPKKAQSKRLNSTYRSTSIFYRGLCGRSNQFENPSCSSKHDCSYVVK